eukprot:jgi/Sobl393_1/539/SZX70654.1
MEAIFAKGAAARDSKVPQVTREDRQIIKGRGLGIDLHPGSVSEQVLRPDIVKKCFGHLRRFGLFHMTHHSFDSQGQMLLAAVAVHEELLAYGKAAEESEWKAHRQDCCKKCGGARFDIVLGKEVPVRRFWYIRPQESIEELMMDPDFVTAIRTAKAKVVGNYWDSPELNRVNANRLWIVPFCHAFFLGVFKDFMEAIFAKGAAARDSKVPQVTRDDRQIIKGRGLGIGLHPSFNRRPRDVLSSSKGSWQIEDFARALECFLPLMFRPLRSGSASEQVLRPDIVKKCFGHLRRFGLFHMTHHSFDSQGQMLLAAVAAHEELLAYGKAAEEDLSGGKLCTFNLHLLACQLLMQVVHRGLTAPLGELWIERLVGGKKGRSKGGTKSNPEVTMMIDELVTRALRRARLKYAHLNLQTWQEHVGRDAPLGVPRSVLRAEGHLMGAPKLFAAEAWGSVQNLVKEKLSINLEPDEWQRWDARWDEVVVQQYQRAVLPGGSYATSTLYPLSRSRDGTWVMVPYTEGGQVKPYAARGVPCCGCAAA